MIGRQRERDLLFELAQGRGLRGFARLAPASRTGPLTSVTAKPGRAHREHDGGPVLGVRHHHDRHRGRVPFVRQGGAALEPREVGRKPVAEILVEAQRQLSG